MLNSEEQIQKGSVAPSKGKSLDLHANSQTPKTSQTSPLELHSVGLQWDLEGQASQFSREGQPVVGRWLAE